MTVNLETAYADCTLCPRACHVNRMAGQLGFCGADAHVLVARAARHFWEEPPISADNGSGTVFFAHCQLQCVYCQNAAISRTPVDLSANPWARRPVSADRLAGMFCDLADQGAVNINLVSATHYVPTVVEALRIARGRGLDVPIVYNTGGYESVETLRCLAGLVDVYLTDLKHLDPVASARYAHAADYPQVALRALAQMVGQTGAPVYGELPTGEQIMLSGTIVRHLLLPGALDDAERIVDYLGTEYGDRIAVSLMSQYVPLVDAGRYPQIARRVDPVDYENLVDRACLYDFDECFIQEGDSADVAFIPPFDGQGVP